MDEQRRIACAEIERLRRDSEKQQELSAQKVSIMLVHLKIIFLADGNLSYSQENAWDK